MRRRRSRSRGQIVGAPRPSPWTIVAISAAEARRPALTRGATIMAPSTIPSVQLMNTSPYTMSLAPRSSRMKNTSAVIDALKNSSDANAAVRTIASVRSPNRNAIPTRARGAASSAAAGTGGRRAVSSQAARATTALLALLAGFLASLPLGLGGLLLGLFLLFLALLLGALARGASAVTGGQVDADFRSRARARSGRPQGRGLLRGDARTRYYPSAAAGLVAPLSTSAADPASARRRS